MNAPDELVLLRIWKEDAMEHIADDERVIQSQDELLLAMHTVINVAADHLHQAQRAMLAYVDTKIDIYQKIETAKKTRKTRSKS